MQNIFINIMLLLIFKNNKEKKLYKNNLNYIKFKKLSFLIFLILL